MTDVPSNDAIVPAGDALPKASANNATADSAINDAGQKISWDNVMQKVSLNEATQQASSGEPKDETASNEALDEIVSNDPKHVCEECLKKTRIGYDDKGGFFTPHLKGINYLEVGRSSIISNPITIFLEKLLVLYIKIGKFFRRLNAKLFPRHDKIYGTVIDSSLIGNISFAKRADELVPIHHLTLQFWSRSWFGKWRKLSEGYTAEDGTFRLPFELAMAHLWFTRRTRFEIYQVTHAFSDETTSRKVYTLFKSIIIPKSDLIGMEYNLRNIYLFFWEYRTDTALPRAIVESNGQNAPQAYSEGREDALRAQFIPIELTKVKHLEQIRVAPETISLQQIQSDYPENLTVCIEKKLPGYTRGDHWFGERMMNGMNRGAFVPDANEPGYYWMKYFGKGRYNGNNEYAFPDAAIKFYLKADGLPTPVEIELAGPLNAFEKDPWKQQVFTPEDGDLWLHAKRVARVNGGLCTEVDEHFAGTHTNIEQYAVAVYRNMRFNPLTVLLFPHLKDVVLINHSADKILLKDYIPRASAFSYAGLLERCKDIMGVLDWKSYKTTLPLSEAHTSAKAESLFWNTTQEYVSWFIKNNIDDIKKYWYEVYCFSEDLVNHSVPVFLSEVDSALLDDRENKRNDAMKTYYAAQFSFDFDLPREKRNGVLHAVSPLTRYKTFPVHIENMVIQDLTKICTYMIFVASYLHTWANEHQYQDIGEVLYNSLGLRFGEKESGVLAPESDLGISPDLTRSTQMMWFSNFLSRTEYGFITRNEDKDINPYFSRLLHAKKAEFEALGVNVDDIESCTNI
jgi:hypothetical protein